MENFAYENFGPAQLSVMNDEIEDLMARVAALEGNAGIEVEAKLIRTIEDATSEVSTMNNIEVQPIDIKRGGGVSEQQITS